MLLVVLLHLTDERREVSPKHNKLLDEEEYVFTSSSMYKLEVVYSRTVHSFSHSKQYHRATSKSIAKNEVFTLDVDDKSTRHHASPLVSWLLLSSQPPSPM